MHLCYLDESGTPELSGNTSHFVLLALAIPANQWLPKDDAIAATKTRYDLQAAEIHTGWMTRRYAEQEKVPDFEAMDRATRRREATKQRQAMLLHTAATKPARRLQELKKAMRKTDPYIHLTLGERLAVLRDLSDALAGWQDAVLFADAIDKRSQTLGPNKLGPLEEAFTQVVARFDAHLQRVLPNELGILIADDNQAASSQLTDVMRGFYKRGVGEKYRWRRDMKQIVETPLFVDSHLTGMIQMADLCAYAVRRFCEHGETDLFNRIYPRFDRTGRKLVGLRHFTGPNRCRCRICEDHHRAA